MSTQLLPGIFKVFWTSTNGAAFEDYTTIDVLPGQTVNKQDVKRAIQSDYGDSHPIDTILFWSFVGYGEVVSTPNYLDRSW